MQSIKGMKMVAEQFQNCSLNTSQLQVINLTLSVTGGVGCLLAAVVLLVLTCIKAYRSALQRLFMYGVLSTMIHEAIHLASIEQQFEYRHQAQVCTALGFLTNWTAWVVCDFHVCVVVYLLCAVYSQLKGNEPFSRISRSATSRRLTEVLCILFSVLLPLIILWVPFKNQMYGLDESWCWIKAYDEDCKSIGLRDKLIYGYSFFEAVGMGALCTSVGIIIVYCTLASKYSNIRHLLKLIMTLSFAIVAFMILLNLMLMIDLLKKSTYEQEIYFAIAATLSDLIFLSGFLLTFYAPKCKKHSPPRLPEHPPDKKQGVGTEYGTFRESDRESALSHTDFQVQFTGEFTSITEGDMKI